MLAEHRLHLLKNHGLRFCPLAGLSAPEAGWYSGLWSAASMVSGTEPYTGLGTRSGNRVQLPETLCSRSFLPSPAGVLFAQKPVVHLIAGSAAQSMGGSGSGSSHCSASPTSSRGTPSAEPSTSWSL